MSVDKHLFEIVLDLDSTGVIRGGKLVNKTLDDIDQKVKHTKTSAKSLFRDFESSANKLAGPFQAGLGAAKAFLGVLTAVGVGVGALGMYALNSAADLDSMRRSLEAIEGKKGAQEVERRIRQIALGPGLGVEEALGTYRGFRGARLGREFSAQLTEQLGNAIALNGGGRSELSRVAAQFAQMAGKPFLQGEELMTIGESLPGIRGMVADRFGTADPELLKKQGVTSMQVLGGILEEMSKLPRVEGGIRSGLDNLMDAIKSGAAETGLAFSKSTGLITDGVAKAITDQLGPSGQFALLGERISSRIESIFGTSSAEEAVTKFIAGIDVVTEGLTNFATNLVGAWNIFKSSPSLLGMMIRQAEAMFANSQGAFNSQGALHKRLTSKAPKVGPFDDAGLFGAAIASLNGLQDEGSPIVRELVQIKDNTKAMVEIRQMMIGGGAATNAAFNARNIGGWSGYGNHPAKGMDMIIQGLGLLMADKQVMAARHQTFAPKGI